MAATTIKRTVRQSARRVVVSIGKRFPFILRWTRRALAAGRKVVYRQLCRRNPVDPKVVVFEAYSGRAYACSPRALYQAMLADERFADYEFIWVFLTPQSAALAEAGFEVADLEQPSAAKRIREPLDLLMGRQALDELKRAKLVRWGSREYMRSYARAGTWISNFVVPPYLWPREGQVFLETWHGTPLKQLGCDISAGGNVMYEVRDIHDRYRREGRRLTYLISPSAFATDKFATAFELVATGRTDAIIEEGYPRNDALVTSTPEQVAEIRRRLDIPEGKRVILYAPTWRDDQHQTGLGYTFETGVDFDRLRTELGDDTVVLFRAHYFIASRFDFARYDGFVRDVSRIGDINDLYLVSDVLVTDYSSVAFDFANLERPIVYYMYDLESYTGNLRGFYLTLDELPGPVARTEDELSEALHRAGRPDPEIARRYGAFNARFNYLDDGHASERVLARVFPPDGGIAGIAATSDAGDAAL